MDYFTCEKCSTRFDEFEMNFKAVQEDKKILCNDCRLKEKLFESMGVPEKYLN